MRSETAGAEDCATEQKTVPDTAFPSHESRLWCGGAAHKLYCFIDHPSHVYLEIIPASISAHALNASMRVLITTGSRIPRSERTWSPLWDLITTVPMSKNCAIGP